ncbi:MAG TPA: hypothetical protein VML55_23630 [Planctomycetaceae bacterium]|nr:hypothetical protein [Planctomycetaceae bacterium]
MRFRSSSSPPPYLNRRDQMRMLALVGLLAGVLLAMQAVANPRMWAWLFSTGSPTAPEPDHAAQPSPRDVDFRVRFDNETALADDEFLARPAGGERERAGVGGGGDDSPGQAESSPRESTPDRELAPTFASAAAPSAARERVTIDAGVLRSIQDDYVGLRAAEADAYFHVLIRARDVDQRVLERASAGSVDFAVLMDDPDRFRGRPVTVEGDLKGLTPVPIEHNDYGIERLWEGWLFNRNSWPNPWCVRVLEVPAGIPQGSRITQPVRVRVTGYFFKKYGYASEGGFHKAPLLLGKRIDWIRSEPRAAEALPGLGPYLGGAAVLIAAGLGFMVWRMRASDRRFEQTHLKRLSAAPRESIEALAGLETSDVSDLFRKLAEEESSRPGPADDRTNQDDPASGA